MSLTSYRAAPPRVRVFWFWRATGVEPGSLKREIGAISSEVFALHDSEIAANQSAGAISSGVSALRTMAIAAIQKFEVLLVWRRPTLPRLKTQYHWRDGA
jgi:hypothetical protein